MRFENPTNGYVEEANAAPLWCLLFGCIYFAVKGIWAHAVAALLLALVTFGISWLIYPFFATQIVRTHYLRHGWIEIDARQHEPIITEAVRARSNTGRNVLLASLVVLVLIGAASVWHTGPQQTNTTASNALASSPKANGASLISLDQNAPPCGKGKSHKICFVKFGRVKVQVENESPRAFKRAIVYSDDMKQDAQDLLLATGFLMLTINPNSSPDERGNLFKTLILATKDGTSTNWGGYAWRLAYTNSDAMQIVALHH